MEQEQAIKAGCIVQLKSGGPRMTVVAVAGGDVFCEFYAGVTRKKEMHLAHTLEVVGKQELPSDVVIE